jgi:phosphatidylethanolamine/phosphatidyl-N-methylethanolamine N-methyltransferase
MNKRDATAGTSRSGDWARFFATWVRNPLKIGAIAPSSPSYCAEMVAQATTDLDGPILEIGPGLGVVTRALVDAGVAPERITSIEYDPDFARTLQQRFPRVNVIQGDGLDLDATLGARAGEKFAAILFAVPIVHLGQPERQALFRDYIGRLQPGGNLTQLSYLLTAPVKPLAGVFSVSSSRIVWDNIPPARVWIYTPKPGAGNAARSGQ